MKKLMTMLAVAVMTAAVQAATVSWQTVAMYNEAGSKVADTATLYVYLMNKTTYDGMSDIWAAYGADVLAGGTTADGIKATGKYTHKATVGAPESTTANTTYYAALIATYGTGDNMKYYAEKASVTTGDDGNGAYTTFGTGAIDTAAHAATGWTSAAVPEPTSGLLLVLGMAGLALRRRRA